MDEAKVSSNEGDANGIVDVKGSRRSYELLMLREGDDHMSSVPQQMSHFLA